MRKHERLITFLMVGGLATLCQYSILIGLVELFDADPVIASAIGAFFAAVLNYCLNKVATFKSTAKHTTTLPRFIVVAAIAIVLNAALMALFTKTFSLPYIPAQFVTTCIITIFTYNANRIWTFKQ
ncbi:MAG: GtrA family protein [Hyphomicrobiales bacterium]